MDRYEKVRIAAVGNLRPVVQGDISVRRPRVHHPDIGISGLYLLSEELRNGKGDVLLVCFPVGTHRPCILSAMTCIYYHGLQFQVCGRLHGAGKGKTRQKQDRHYIFGRNMHFTTLFCNV